MRRDSARRRVGHGMAAFAAAAIAASGCGGGTQTPRLALPVPRGVTGSQSSPAVQAALAVQDALHVSASVATMRQYLDQRFGGTWIVNDGRTGVLHFGVVRLTAADTRYARSHLHMGRHASFALGNDIYSQAQLDRFQSTVDAYVEHHLRSLDLGAHATYGLGVSPPDDAVELTVSKGDASFWISRVAPLIPADALVIRYASGPATAVGSVAR